MTKLLNLDSLAPPAKQFSLGGTEYEVKPLTVGAYIKKQQEAKDVQETDDPAEQMERAVKMIVDAVPGLDKNAIEALTMAQISALIEFIVSDPTAETKTPDEAASADAAAAAGVPATGN